MTEPQRPPIRKRLLDDSESTQSDTNKRASGQFLITHICATNVVFDPRRMLTGLYLVVDVDGKTTRTSTKPVLAGRYSMEWDEKILLPSQLSTFISFKIYTSFELKSSPTNGVLLCVFKTAVGDLLGGNGALEPIGNSHRKILRSDPSLKVIAEQRTCAVNGSMTRLESNVVIDAEQLTASGHRALLRYRQFHKRRDLDNAMICFEGIRNSCPSEDPNRSAVLFNVATVMFIRCQADGRYDRLDVPIKLYHEAFGLNASDHDRSVTALDLCFALLARLQTRVGSAGNAGSKTAAEDSPSSAVEHYAYGVAGVALQMAGITVSQKMIKSGISQADGTNPEDKMLVKMARTGLRSISHADPRFPEILAAFGTSLCLQFRGNHHLVDINEAISMLEYSVHLTPNGHPSKPTRLDQLGVALYRRFQHLGDLADINKSILMLEEAVGLIPDGHPHRPDCVHHLARSLFGRYDRFGDLSDLNKSILKSEEATCLSGVDHPYREDHLITFARSLTYRFERLGDIGDLNRCIPTWEEVARLTPETNPYKPARLRNLTSSLFRRFELLGDIADIRKSISITEKAIRLIPRGHPSMATELKQLANLLLLRFERLGDITDLNKSITVLEDAVRVTDDGDTSKQSLLRILGSSLSNRFKHTDDVADIRKSISALEEALRLTHDDDPHKPALLNLLGDSLCHRFQVLGDVADVNKSIRMLEQIVDSAPKDDPSRPGSLNALGIAFSCRFQHLGDPGDLQKCITTYEKALCLTPDGDPDKPTGLNNLGNSLCNRFQILGDIADINQSISLSEKALSLTPVDNPQKPNVLNSLGTALMYRFEHLGDLVDSDKSISAFEGALRLTSSGSTQQRYILKNLANSLTRRFEHIGDLSDIDRAIAMSEKVVHLTPDGHLDKAMCLSNLSSSLFHRFEHLGNPADLNRSISLSELAVHLTPKGHPSKPAKLNNLGSSLARRFEHLGDLVDINKSIQVSEEAVAFTPNGHHDKLPRMSNLGHSLLMRFQRFADVADIKRSIQIFEETIVKLPDGHPEKSRCLDNLGIAFMKYHEHSHDPSKLSDATMHFSRVSRASSGSTYVRFVATRQWIFTARLRGDSKDILDAYATSISLLPQLAWIGLPLKGRHRLLAEAADTARDAAAAALEVCFPEKAVEWLEQGRSVVWTQFLHLRSPLVDELRVEYPALAGQFLRVSEELEHASSRGNVMSDNLAMNTVSGILAQSLENEVQKHHELARKREKLLSDIRSLPGFDRFLLPKPIKQLAAFAKSGPVVYVNASKHRCDALILKAESGEVIPVPLSGVKYRDVEFLFGLLLKRDYPVLPRGDISKVMPSTGELPSEHLLDMFLRQIDGVEEVSGDRDGKIHQAGYTPDDRLRGILAFLWKRVVNPVLDALGLSTPPATDKELTRIFWCPTGPFAFLPIHAAGLYDTNERGTKLSDFAVSSYIPNLNALAPSWRETKPHSPNIHLVAVPQPPNDGQVVLTCVKEEIDQIKRLASRSPFVTLHDSDGTVEDVMEEMKTSDWVHFSCHGIQDPANPLNSGLCLADERLLKLSDIIKLSRPHGGLAFLSACQTATGDENLSEESVHLAAGMLLAGYGSVIATMWSIMDRDAPKVAQVVYEHLFKDGKVPDTTEAAKALHIAVQNLRNFGSTADTI